VKQQLLTLFSDAETPREQRRAGRTQARWQHTPGLSQGTGPQHSSTAAQKYPQNGRVGNILRSLSCSLLQFRKMTSLHHHGHGLRSSASPERPSRRELRTGASNPPRLHGARADANLPFQEQASVGSGSVLTKARHKLGHGAASQLFKLSMQMSSRAWV